MATQSAIFTPGPDHIISALVGTTASAEQTYHSNGIFAINGTGDFTITFGSAGAVPAPTASNFRVPSGVVAVYDLSSYYASFKVFNLGGSAINVYWQELQRN